MEGGKTDVKFSQTLTTISKSSMNGFYGDPFHKMQHYDHNARRE